MLRSMCNNFRKWKSSYRVFIVFLSVLVFTFIREDYLRHPLRRACLCECQLYIFRRWIYHHRSTYIDRTQCTDLYSTSSGRLHNPTRTQRVCISRNYRRRLLDRRRSYSLSRSKNRSSLYYRSRKCRN